MSSDNLTPIDLHPWDLPPLLQRSAELRDDDALQRMWASSTSRLLLVDAQSRFLVDPFGSPPVGDFDENVAFLGIVEHVAWFARRVEDIDGGATIRDAKLSHMQQQLVSAALAVLNWVDGTRFCARCGGALRRTQGGFSAVCTLCDRAHFPRTDPAVIVAVLDERDRVFLAHQGSWPPGRASILAGFIEAGESAENAVYREVYEEAQLKVDSCRFLGSQPWPFPRSLMLCYVARSRSAGLVDGEELEWGGWYAPEDVEVAVADGSLILPGQGSVAGRVLDAWRAGTLPAP